MNEQSAFIFNEESHEKIVKENEEEKRKELKRKKKTNARQRAYYQRQKDLKKNEEVIKTVPKSNAERQRKFRQHNAEKSYMDIEEKRKELKRKKKTNARQRAYYQRQKDLKKNEEVIKTVPKSNAERQRKFRQHNAEKSYMDIEEKRKELKRKKKTNARQRAYYQRQKDLKKNEEVIKTVPKSNAERQRKFRQHNAEKSYMDIKRRKLCSNEENIVQCSAAENIENVTLQENQFHSQQLHIYEQRNECITPEVILHRNTAIPGDGNCLFHSLISVLQLQIESGDLRNQLRDSPFLNSCHNPQEAYNILSSSNDYGDLDCLYLFSKMYNQNICVHYCFYNITTTNEDTIFCHFKANDTQNWIHLHLREQHFTPFYYIS